VSSDWKEVTLGEVINLKRGHDLPSQERKSGYIPIVSSSGISDFHSESKAVGPGVITGRYGTIGQVFYIEDDYWPLNTTLYVEDFRGNFPKYIYYLLKTLNFHQFSDKSSVPGVNRNHVHLAVVNLPPLEQQNTIAQILSSLDDKIELNRRMNRTLEQMARALFQSWFVDFDPVRAKMRGEVPEGMDAETAALFPDALEGVEGREIPVGWRVGTVGDIAIQSKDQLNPLAQADTVFAHFSIPAFDAGMQPTLELGSEIKSNKFIVPDNAILVSKLNPRTPRVWIFDKPSNAEISICSTEFIPLVPRSSTNFSYLYFCLTSPEFSKNLSGNASGTSNSHQRVKPNDMLIAPISIPNDSVLNIFNRAMSAILERLIQNLRESSQLERMRDELLPRLLSGELDVSNWVDAHEEK
jgi:type I restriction enzyme, S subunit